MNEPELIRAAEATGGKFYTPLDGRLAAQGPAQALEGPAGHRSADPALEHLAGAGAFPGADHAGMGSPETQANGIISLGRSCSGDATSGPVGVGVESDPLERASGDVRAGRCSMTARQLESRISALRASVRRLLALHGLSWVLGAARAAGRSLAGLADWLFHLDSVVRAGPPGGPDRRRWLWLLYRRVLRPLLVRFADLDIAMRIEERWPGLNDRLASTIQFLRLDVGRRAVRVAGAARGDGAAGDRGDRRDRLPRGRSSRGRSSGRWAWPSAALALGGGCSCSRPRTRRGSP